MITETVKDFATEILRPAAYEADAKAEAPPRSERSAELGITMINVPEEYDGGAAAERGVVTNALVAEAMAYGDMGLAIPLLAPAASRPRSPTSAPTSSRPPTCPTSPVRTSRSPRSSLPSPSRSSTPSTSPPRPPACPAATACPV